MSMPELKFPPTGLAKLEYTRAISFVFDNPNWLMNAVWSLVCQLVAGVIPIVPQMVLLGYQFEVFDGLQATSGQRYPDFNINRLVEYLTRGVWPMLAALIATLVWAFGVGLIALCGGGCFAVLINAGGEEASGVIGIIGAVIGIALLLVLLLVLFLILTPLVLRAGIAQDLAATFDFAWIRDFLSKTWLEIVLASLFCVVVSLAVTLATCGLGWFIVAPLTAFVQAHFWHQFYVLYLSRGGTPVMAKVAMPQSYIPPQPMPPPM